MIGGLFLILMFAGEPVSAVGPMAPSACVAASREAADFMSARFGDGAARTSIPKFHGARLDASDVTMTCAPDRPVIRPIAP